jgi:flagellar motility protein MotE (MotC chaperone)
MIRILQSSWLAALVGCLVFLGTTVVVIHPEDLAAARSVPSDHSAADDPSWKFKNPDFDQWVAQMKDEKETLALREQQLSEWQSRLDAERQEISTVTQTVSQLQADFDKNVIRFRAQETDNVKHQAKLIAAMSPAGAAAMFNEMADDDVVKILFIMKTDEASVILDTMSKLGKPEARRAAVLTGRLHHVLPQATNAVPTTAP